MPFGDEPVAVVEHVGAVLSEEAYRHRRGRGGRSDENGLGHLWRRGNSQRWPPGRRRSRSCPPRCSSRGHLTARRPPPPRTGSSENTTVSAHAPPVAVVVVRGAAGSATGGSSEADRLLALSDIDRDETRRLQGGRVPGVGGDPDTRRPCRGVRRDRAGRREPRRVGRQVDVVALRRAAGEADRPGGRRVRSIGCSDLSMSSHDKPAIAKECVN